MPSASTARRSIAVYGASGHTGRFVVDELLRRGLPVLALGRQAATLPSHVPARAAALDDAATLAEALAACSVVINCAGPFLDTAAPLAQAAVRSGCHYIDVTAEQASAMATLEAFDGPARARGLVVIPAAGFYGGLADLLATALLGDAPADALTIAVALDRWWPTEGTRKTGARNQVPRVVRQHGRLVTLAPSPNSTAWTFGSPHGTQPMVELPFSEIITLASHLAVPHIRSLLTASSLADIRDAATPAPAASDAQGRSAQRFELVVQAERAGQVRQASARGQDIYAVSAPLVVEAAARLHAGAFARGGALSLGAAFGARGFLAALSPQPLQLTGLSPGEA